MNARECKAQQIVAAERIRECAGFYEVASQSGEGKYRVVLNGGERSCTCPDHEITRAACKHILAVEAFLRQQQGEPSPVIEPIKRKTYPQAWASYNAAQQNERRHFMALLADLCAGIPEPSRKPTRGQQPLRRCDAVYAAVFKVYSTLSARRFNGDLEEAHRRGYIGHMPHFNSVLNCLDNADMTDVFYDLITRSALPLRAVETDFAVDSSGFSVSRFVRWHDEKYGEQSGRDWVKAHICCGVKTNVVTAAIILDRDAADSPRFRPLVEATAANFTIREASADKAYSSKENVEVIARLGGFPAIMFKANATGAAGGDFEKLFYFFGMHREEFLAMYHKRSNVESTFSMVKRKFGDAVRAKSDAAKRNEVLAKLVAHNVCCVIASWYEMGVVPDFLNHPADSEPRHLLKFPV